MLTLADVPAAFAAARVAASAAARYAPGTAPTNACRYCGKLALFSVSTILDGHARCCVTLEFMRAIHALYWGSSTTTMGAIAAACSVSIGTVSRWCSGGAPTPERKQAPVQPAAARTRSVPIARWVPGTDPLDPMPMTDEQRDDLVARARAAEARVGSSVRNAVGRVKRHLTDAQIAARRAERDAAHQQALAGARSLASGGSR